MRITAVRSRTVRVPLATPTRSHSGTMDAMWYLLVDVETDAGIVGVAYLWAFSANGARALAHTLAELATVAVGENPLASARLWERMWRRMNQWGHAGLAMIALSAIDIAAWDIAGKAAGQSLARLLGTRTDRVPVYASEGLWATDDHDALAREAAAFVARGFGGVKMRLGGTRAADDLAAVRAVRAAIGDDVPLMVDVNGGWTMAHALRMGRQLEEYGLYWLEDPLPADDLAGHARLAAALDTPIATGEKAYAPQGCRDVLAAGACDILMPDVLRVGGVTGWVRAAALADAAHLPVCSHLFPEINVHLVASAPTAVFLEHMTWSQPLFNEELPVSEGTVAVPTRPGLGVSWNEAAIARYRID